MIRARQCIFIGLFSFLVAACSEDNRDLIQYIHQIKSRKSAALKPVPTFSMLPGFKFPDDESRRDPLKPLSPKKGSESAVYNPERVKQALEDYYLLTLQG